MSDTVVTDDKQDLEYTKKLRIKIVEATMVNGAVPADFKEKTILLQTLADMDRITLGKMRIKSDEKTAAQNENAAAIIATALTQVRPADFKTVSTRSMPELSTDIPVPVLIPGETDVGTKHLTYDDFVASNPQQE